MASHNKKPRALRRTAASDNEYEKDLLYVKDSQLGANDKSTLHSNVGFLLCSYFPHITTSFCFNQTRSFNSVASFLRVFVVLTS
jgi:hypothetical protein